MRESLGGLLDLLAFGGVNEVLGCVASVFDKEMKRGSKVRRVSLSFVTVEMMQVAILGVVFAKITYCTREGIPYPRQAT